MSQCADHPFEPAEGLCLSCGAPFCAECLIEDPRSYPRCKDCAIAAAGIRRHAGRPQLVSARELKRLRREWRRGRRSSGVTRAEPVRGAAEETFVPLDLDRWGATPSAVPVGAEARTASTNREQPAPPSGDPELGGSPLGPGLLRATPPDPEPEPSTPPAPELEVQPKISDPDRAEPLRAWDRVRRPRPVEEPTPAAPAPTPLAVRPPAEPEPDSTAAPAPTPLAFRPPAEPEPAPAEQPPTVGPIGGLPGRPPPPPPDPAAQPPRGRAGARERGGSSLFGRSAEDRVRRSALLEDDDDEALPSAAELVASLNRERKHGPDTGAGPPAAAAAAAASPLDAFAEPAADSQGDLPRYDSGQIVVEAVPPPEG